VHNEQRGDENSRCLACDSVSACCPLCPRDWNVRERPGGHSGPTWPNLRPCLNQISGPSQRKIPVVFKLDADRTAIFPLRFCQSSRQRTYPFLMKDNFRRIAVILLDVGIHRVDARITGLERARFQNARRTPAGWKIWWSLGWIDSRWIYGSASVGLSGTHVRFGSKSGHVQCKRPCLLRAKSGHTFKKPRPEPNIPW